MLLIFNIELQISSFHVKDTTIVLCVITPVVYVGQACLPYFKHHREHISTVSIARCTRYMCFPVPLLERFDVLSGSVIPPLRSTVVRASARGAGGRGSIPDRVTPKT